ncbi:MAG: transposase [Desulfobaccales bacterium]
MSTYLRSRRPGGTFFFTAVTFQRRRLFKDHENFEILSNIISEVQKDYPFTLDAWVFMPDHLHCLWTLPPDEADYSKRWGLIKAKFTKAISQESGRSALLTGSKIRHRESTIWQRRFWEHQIKDERDLQVHLDYIHFNPVKHGLVKSPGEWQNSSFHEFVSRNLYPINWGENIELKFDQDFGE